MVLQMKKPHRIPFQDAVAVGCGKVELIQDSRRVFDVLGGEVIRAYYDAVRSDQADEKAERLRIINQIVVMEST